MTTVKNWRKFQHYKHRDPPWIRLYRNLLNDREWHLLDGDTAKRLVMIWLIASEYEGKLPPARDLAFRLRTSEAEVLATISKLSHWLEQDASTPLAECYQDAPSEAEAEAEAEAEKRAAARDYVFEGEIIKLSRKHFDQWTVAYKNLDLLAELTARDAWLQAAPTEDQKNWFISTSQHLANRNMKAKQGAQVIQLNDPYRGVL